MKKLFSFIEKFRKPVLGAFILVTLVAAWQLRSLKINSDILSALPEDDPVAALYREIGAEFGGNDMGMVVVGTANVFDPVFLEQLAQITDTIALMPGVSQVTSLINVIDIRDEGWGIEIAPLIDQWNIPQSAQELDSIRRYVLNNDMYRSALVSDDGTYTLVVYTLQDGADKEAIAHDIRLKLRQYSGLEMYFGGLPILMNDVNHLIINDIVRLVPLVFLLILGILYAGFRSLRQALLPLLSAGMAVVWSLGLMAFLGYQLSIISDVIPVVLLAVGSAYTIHIINSLNAADEAHPETIGERLRLIALPVSLSSFTTVFGFVSFVFGAYLTIIRDFGLFSAAGTLVALLSALVFVPALYFQFPGMRGNKYRGRRQEANNKNSLLEAFARRVVARPRRTIAIWLVIIVLAGTGYIRLRTSVNMTEYFRSDFPSRVAEEVLQKRFGGSMPIFLVFEGDVQSPELLLQMWEAEKFMKEDPNVQVSQSVASLIARMNEVMGEGRTIPADRAKIEQLWFLIEGQDIMKTLVNPDMNKAVIQSRFASITTGDIVAFTEKMTQYVASRSTDEIRIRFTGITPVYNNLNRSLVKSQVSSLLIATGLVALFVSLMMASVFKGMMATIPVVVTSLMMPGLMGLLGIPLDVATVLVGSLALGIGIDYAIHISTAYYQFRDKGLLPDDAIIEAIGNNGKAVAINVLSVGIGFLVLIFSELAPLQNFGVLVAVGMLTSGLSALSLLPALILYSEKTSLKIK
ncbi:MAG: RND family transporter [Bacteroidetes bacterium]|nr:RND family transporter [Bacteroidota bacterium]